MKIRAPKKGIIIKNLAEMPFDRHGCHATGRRIYAINLVLDEYIAYDEYEDEEGDLFYV